MNIVTDEKMWAERAIATHSFGQNPIQTLDRVARYYYQYEKCSKKDILGKLEQFLLRCDPSISLVLWADQLERISKSADRRPLIELDGVSVSSSELAVVNHLKGTIKQRLMFTLICLAKYENFVRKNDSNWVKTEHKHIMALANIVTSTKRQAQLLRELRDDGLIAFSKRVDNLNIKVCCIDDGQCELYITDFRNLGNQYMMYKGGQYIHCEGCGLTVKKNSNAQRYCPSCAADMYSKRSIQSVMRHRAISLYGNIPN